MSTQQRIAHLSGLNSDQQGQVPFRGSFYQVQGGGAPGILGGIPAGFTVCIGMTMMPGETAIPWTSQFDVTSTEGFPEGEFICGGIVEGDDDKGWNWIAEEGEELSFIDFAATLEVSPQTDLLAVATLVPDPSLYDPVAVSDPTAIVGFNNNIFGTSPGEDPFIPGNDFYIGGAPDLTAFGDPAELGGLVNCSLSSVWITPGIPTIEQVTDFMQASTQAGLVVPAAWAPARTASNLNPAVPDAPTGHYWSVSDIDPSAGLGGTWVDRIGGVILERVGIISGSERIFARDPIFPTPEN